MGLDGVELVMAIEDDFDISLDDAEAAKVFTPRQLIDLVQTKVQHIEPSVCLSQRAFNFLRRYLIERHALPRKKISPKTKLSDLIPTRQRLAFLQGLAANIGTKSPPPSMARPRWLKLLLTAVCLGVGLWVGFAFGADLENRFELFLFAAGVSALVGVAATKPFRTAFRKELASVGDLALWVRRHKTDLANYSQKAWTRDQIAARVRKIIVDVLGCQPDFSEDARFIEDLGLN